LKASGVEVEIRELDADRFILRVSRGAFLERGRARFVERRHGLLRRGGAGRRGGLRGRRRHTSGLLLAADDPADEDAEEYSGDTEGSWSAATRSRGPEYLRTAASRRSPR